MPQSDTDLITLTLSGDEKAFETIVERYWDKLHRYTLRLLNYNQADAEDATSTAFIKAYQNLAGYNPKLKFSSWIYRIAHNEAVNIIRKNSKFFSFDPFTSSLSLLPGKADVDITKLEIEQALSKLKPADRNILILFYLEELSIKEIAEILKSTPGSIKSRSPLARKQARQTLSS